MVARYLGVSEGWLRDRMRLGEIPYIKVGEASGNVVRFRVDDLDSFMERYLHPATAGPLAEVESEPEPVPRRKKRAG
jgi:excisionase family DNA binding protein